MLKNIVKYTFLLRVGRNLYYYVPYFLATGVSQPVWSAVFHSVSAFCTAGFSIYTDNQMQFQSDVYVNVVIMVLCVAGAMGFIMMTDISRWMTRKEYRISFTTKVIVTIHRNAGFVGNRTPVFL